MLLYKNFPLKSFHTFSISNIIAKKIFIVHLLEELKQVYNECIVNNLPFVILGEGSNTLFIENYLGIVIINKVQGLRVLSKKKFWLIHIYSGEKWHNVVKKTLKIGIYGLENLAFIPGCVGSSVIQNIGAYGMEIKDICLYVDILYYKNFKIQRINAKDCQFNYRYSIFQNKLKKFVIIAVGLGLKKKWVPNLSHIVFKNFNCTNVLPQKIFNFIGVIRKKKYLIIKF
ncbi:UDP-N-acetylenolpyruvoylglucosamine reductase [Buchnera aphidicola (Nipponaphis monzeni)]|uniref:UDP-N-acetylenolpyruvoylglucosamine reductase n=1 Tax=Buchnera aphidicola (Nipponaphis monzeni) TaxID=2495405 RepID=A0A455T9Q4_9GAMM|nr:UDP-N-acetylmuramate dehydrogenase [Buchnera aphidicola]BBI01053.1 UDP-N-acetylenolpyruvoylglucosamine reductase [Buchnera aphidicola (Nipponaphis monzeni)]